MKEMAGAGGDGAPARSPAVRRRLSGGMRVATFCRTIFLLRADPQVPPMQSQILPENHSTDAWRRLGAGR